MKAKHLILFLPLFSLVACSGEAAIKEVNEEKALEIANKISASLEDTYPFEMTANYENHLTNSRGEDITFITKRVRKASANNCYRDYTERKETVGKENIITYEDRYVIPSGTKNEYVVFEKSSSSNSKEVYRTARLVGDDAGSLFIGGSSHLSLDVIQLNTKYYISSEQEDPVVEINLFKDSKDMENKYYTTNDNDITIKSHSEYFQDNKNRILDFSISYSMKGLMGYEETRIADDKLDSKTKVTIKYPKSVKVSLPSDWRNYLE